MHFCNKCSSLSLAKFGFTSATNFNGNPIPGLNFNAPFALSALNLHNESSPSEQ